MKKELLQLQSEYKKMKMLEVEYDKLNNAFMNSNDYNEEKEIEVDNAFDKYYDSLDTCVNLLMDIIKCDYVVAKKMIINDKINKLMSYQII